MLLVKTTITKQAQCIILGISRTSRHKRSASGAQRAHYRKKRKFELGRQPANTRLGPKRIHEVRVRGGNIKYRALRLDGGNFAWGSESVTRKTRILTVVCDMLRRKYNLSETTGIRYIMHPTTNSFVRIPSSRVPSSRSMPPPSVSGMKPMYVPVCLDEVRTLNLRIQYAQPVSKKSAKAQAAQAATDGATEEPKKLSNHAQRNLTERKKGALQ